MFVGDGNSITYTSSILANSQPLNCMMILWIVECSLSYLKLAKNNDTTMFLVDNFDWCIRKVLPKMITNELKYYLSDESWWLLYTFSCNFALETRYNGLFSKYSVVQICNFRFRLGLRPVLCRGRDWSFAITFLFVPFFLYKS